MVYLNVKYVIATRNYEFFNICAESHWKYNTFEGYYTCSFSKLRHKARQKLWECSLTFPLKNGIVTSYENCTNKYVIVDKRRVVSTPAPGYLRYIKYNFWMAWAIITIYSSKCVQMDPQQLPKTSTFYSRCKKYDIETTVRGWVPPLPLVVGRLNLPLNTS